MDFAWYIVSFVAAIGVLVTVHEFGHFWVARRLGVKVLKFSIGFGRPLWSTTRGSDQTEYVVAAVPLGGYVKMLDEREGEVAGSELGRAFNRQTIGVRTAIVLAGPVFNFLFAIFAYWLMFVLGVGGARPLIGAVHPDSIAAAAGFETGQEISSVQGRPTATWENAIQAIISSALDRRTVEVEVMGEDARRRTLDLSLGRIEVDDLTQGQFFNAIGFEPLRAKLSPIIGKVEAGGPADLGGLRKGDLVVSADGVPITSWEGWVDHVQAHPEVPMDVRVERDGEMIALRVRPNREVENGTGRVIGRIQAQLGPQDQELERYFTTVRYGPVESSWRAVMKTYETSALTLRLFWKMLKLEVSLENLSGPISIAQYAGYTAKIGASKFIEFLAIVSISLGILNLLPIPILDGGHLMYYFIELLKGRPVSEEAQFFGQRLGIAMLFGLMGLAFYNDLARLFG